eukprot:GABV01008844.1.p2 GENE.GABV01008844.1~~GABV01008844.1.p2  ORF type:complete len:159 (-),score=39.29 GABV01008844.1:366-842(-)
MHALPSYIISWIVAELAYSGISSAWLVISSTKSGVSQSKRKIFQRLYNNLSKFFKGLVIFIFVVFTIVYALQLATLDAWLDGVASFLICFVVAVSLAPLIWHINKLYAIVKETVDSDNTNHVASCSTRINTSFKHFCCFSTGLGDVSSGICHIPSGFD